ncbi:MAG: hypothetical protein R2704_09615 [Microthrixaceae bacterium]
MGARGPGHVAALACERLARPQIGVVTVVAGAHLECFMAGVAVAKGELIRRSSRRHRRVELRRPVGGGRVVAERSDAEYAPGARGDVRAEAVRLGDDLQASFGLASPWGRLPVQALAGEHHVMLAAAVGLDAACRWTWSPTPSAPPGSARGAWRWRSHRAAPR